MTDEQIKAVLDDLAQLSLRHGVRIRACDIGLLIEQHDGVEGYYAWRNSAPDGWVAHASLGGGMPDDVNSIDINKHSNHAKVEIVGSSIDRPSVNPELIEVRPYSVRNGHVSVEVSYGGVIVRDMYVPEKSTISTYLDTAKAVIKNFRKKLSSHQQMRILEAEQKHW
ncbi:hypothetical protein [Leisingera aquimarina]|uniref:hypothetical protein n=1 Tax=Leisingera aquimarina TaxID=476529 RepID=UPI000481D9C4|nr:hypothetical protein [Leisingera aquimarina]